MFPLFTYQTVNRSRYAWRAMGLQLRVTALRLQLANIDGLSNVDVVRSIIKDALGMRLEILNKKKFIHSHFLFRPSFPLLYSARLQKQQISLSDLSPASFYAGMQLYFAPSYTCYIRHRESCRAVCADSTRSAYLNSSNFNTFNYWSTANDYQLKLTLQSDILESPGDISEADVVFFSRQTWCLAVICHKVTNSSAQIRINPRTQT